MPTTRRTWKTGTTRRTTGTRTNNYNRTTTRTTTRAGYGTTGTYKPTQYTNYRKQLQAKICSYRNLNQQCNGTGQVTAFSPTGCNKWINYVNKGCYVYKFNNVQFTKFFGKDWNNQTPNTACKYLQKKYGNGIKAVTQGKGNSWLVAATPNVTARPFATYTWK